MTSSLDKLQIVRNFSCKRFYAAPPEQVYAAWTQVDVLTRWWGCAPDTLWKVHAWDLRPGGAVHVSQSFDGNPFELKGEFLVVQSPSHLRFRFGSEIVDAQFSACEGGTELYLQHLDVEDDSKLPLLNAGWSHALELLATNI